MPEYPRQIDSVRLGALAERISAELELLLGLSIELQDAMSGCAVRPGPEAKTLVALQGIDRITQGLCDLARLTREIGLRTPGGVYLDRQPLDAGLRLRELSLRLLPPEDPLLPAAANSPAALLVRDPGDVMLF